MKLKIFSLTKILINLFERAFVDRISLLQRKLIHEEKN